jgi:hypothetical protein
MGRNQREKEISGYLPDGKIDLEKGGVEHRTLWIALLEYGLKGYLQT